MHAGAMIGAAHQGRAVGDRMGGRGSEVPLLGRVDHFGNLKVRVK
ncbi:hypothetical protein BURCENBC7_AP6629 [Burkholderia cenocepacia BC7]|nr:hypothetical protein BURCENBC7_AP6629 [Burkholderia cenocepacia BC7]